MHYIVIGTGPAGVVAAETLRKNDQDANITIVGEEFEPPYSRMAIPYLLEGKIEEEGSYLRKTDGYFSSLNIIVIQDRVVTVEPSAKILILESGTTLHFDKLLIASGSSPVSPPIPGLDINIVHSCWTLEDARRIVELAQPASNVVLIGAGFIGCIILEALVKRFVHLSVIETGNRMVPRMLNDKAGGLIQSWCEEKGIDVQTACSVDSIIKGSDGLVSVLLSNGSVLAADLIITATGVKPNTNFLEDSEIQIDQGLLVNQFLQTSEPDIYAAGDVAQGLDFSTGNHEVQAIQPTATDHGRIAALNMCGKTVPHHGSINMNVLDTLGLISCSFGLWKGVEDGDSVELYNAADYRYINLQFEEDVLVGASCTGITQHIGVIRGLIESRLHLGEWKDRLLKDPTLMMEAYMACTQELG